MSDPEETGAGVVHVGYPSRGSGRASDPRIDDIWRVVERLDRSSQNLRVEVGKIQAAGDVWREVFRDLSTRLQSTDAKIGDVRQEIAGLRVDAVSEAGKIRVEAAGEKGENKWPKLVTWTLVAGLIASIANSVYTSARLSEGIHSEAVVSHEQQRSSNSTR